MLVGDTEVSGEKLYDGGELLLSGPVLLLAVCE